MAHGNAIKANKNDSISKILFKINQRQLEETEEPMDDCAICYIPMNTKEILHQCPLGHSHHFKCITQYIIAANKRVLTCPQCRQEESLKTLFKKQLEIINNVIKNKNRQNLDEKEKEDLKTIYDSMMEIISMNQRDLSEFRSDLKDLRKKLVNMEVLKSNAINLCEFCDSPMNTKEILHQCPLGHSHHFECIAQSIITTNKKVITCPQCREEESLKTVFKKQLEIINKVIKNKKGQYLNGEEREHLKTICKSMIEIIRINTRDLSEFGSDLKDLSKKLEEKGSFCYFSPQLQLKALENEFLDHPGFDLEWGRRKFREGNRILHEMHKERTYETEYMYEIRDWNEIILSYFAQSSSLKEDLKFLNEVKKFWGYKFKPVQIVKYIPFIEYMVDHASTVEEWTRVNKFIEQLQAQIESYPHENVNHNDIRILEKKCKTWNDQLLVSKDLIQKENNKMGVKEWEKKIRKIIKKFKTGIIRYSKNVEWVKQKFLQSQRLIRLLQQHPNSNPSELNELKEDLKKAVEKAYSYWNPNYGSDAEYLTGMMDFLVLFDGKYYNEIYEEVNYLKQNGKFNDQLDFKFLRLTSIIGQQYFKTIRELSANRLLLRLRNI